MLQLHFQHKGSRQG